MTHQLSMRAFQAAECPLQPEAGGRGAEEGAFGLRGFFLEIVPLYSENVMNSDVDVITS